MRGALLLGASLIGTLSACGQQAREQANANNNLVAGSDRPSWQYRVEHDQMRRERTWNASIEAENPPHLSFPYEGGSPAMISLWQGEGDDPFNQQPLLILRNAQLDCNGLCYLAVKFDEGPVLHITGTRSECGENQCVNLNIREDLEPMARGVAGLGFGRRLSSAKRLTLEVPIYHFGSYQYQFNVEGLVWPQPGAPRSGASTDIGG